MKGTWTFILFLAVVITVYTFLNYYFIRKYKKAVKPRFPIAVLLRPALWVLVASPGAAVLFSRLGPLYWAPIAGFVGYGWLAFLFLFLALHGTADIILFWAGKIGVFSPRHKDGAMFFLTLIACVSILFHGLYEARRIQTERIVIKTGKLPSQAQGIKILQLSDIHLSPIIGVETALKLRELIVKENPDVIVSTGDLLDPGIRYPQKITAILRSLPAPLGKYAVAGNHEFFTGIKKSEKFIEQAGFKTLRNSAVSLGGSLNIAGVDDPAVKRFEPSKSAPEKDALAGLDRGIYTILLKHQPRVEKDNLKFFDLQLSGHTHGGQIFPFTIPVKLIFPYISGLYELDKETKLYVSRGAGTWGPPFRFMAPPQITVIELRNTAGAMSD